MTVATRSRAERTFLALMRSPARLAAALAVVFCFGFLAHWVIESLLVYAQIGRGYHVLVEPSLTGAAAAAAVHAFIAVARERRRRVRLQLEQVAQLNHDIRNALDVIVLQAAVSGSEREAVERINSAVARIDSALREISPNGEADTTFGAPGWKESTTG